MNYGLSKIGFIFLAIFSFLVLFNSAALAGGSFTIKWGKDTEPEQHQVKNKQKHKKGGAAFTCSCAWISCKASVSLLSYEESLSRH